MSVSTGTHTHCSQRLQHTVLCIAQLHSTVQSLEDSFASFGLESLSYARRAGVVLIHGKLGVWLHMYIT